MLLTITNRQKPATDLGFILRKHPEKHQTFELSYGRAHVFYPEAAEESCTVALLLEVDPVGLVRNRRGPAGEEQRLGTVLATLKQTNAKRVLDLGCGEGRLLQAVLKEKQFEEVVGMDVSYRSLEIAKDRLNLDRLPTLQKNRIKLLHGSLIYRDKRLAGYDAATVVEVIEHLDPPRLAAFERVLFECAMPGHVLITTPNAEYNVKWETLPAGKFRHKDHRFEWTRAQFQDWSRRVAVQYGYIVRFAPVGPDDSVVGFPTQMAVFSLRT